MNERQVSDENKCKAGSEKRCREVQPLKARGELEEVLEGVVVGGGGFSSAAWGH